MLTHPLLVPIFTLLIGILIVIFPEVFPIFVAFYFIAIGVLGIIKGIKEKRSRPPKK